jgi:Protein of unknown function (DUF3187)
MGRLIRRAFILPLVFVAFARVSAGDPPPSPSPDSASGFEQFELQSPLEIRDEHVLAQGRLTLPATSPDPVGAGVTRLRLSYLWGNSFSWTQDRAGETPTDRRFLIDGETRTLDLTFTHGLGADADIALRLPLRWRGGGSLDGFIDAWHRTFAFLGIEDGGRPSFRRDAFRVEGIATAEQAFSWNDDTGTGLGNVELAGRWRFHADTSSVALVGRVSLPTATDPFVDFLGGGLQLVMRRPLGRAWDLHGGVGGTIEGDTRVAGVTYERTRAHAFAAVVFRPWRPVSLSVETGVASRLVADIDSYPGLHWLINAGLKVALSPRALLEVGMTENLMNQLSTTDFALYFAISARP